MLDHIHNCNNFYRVGWQGAERRSGQLAVMRR